MTHRLRLPFITENPADLNGRNNLLMVARIATPEPGRLLLQGRTVGAVEGKVHSFAPTEHHIAEMLYTYTVGYRGALHLFTQGDQLWADLAAKIEKDGRRR